MRTTSIRIGGASGFWGDSSVGAPQLVQHGDIDYLVFDYLAELTMSILAAARAKNPALGYATDFVSVTMKQVLQRRGREGHPRRQQRRRREPAGLRRRAGRARRRAGPGREDRRGPGRRRDAAAAAAARRQA